MQHCPEFRCHHFVLKGMQEISLDPSQAAQYKFHEVHSWYKCRHCNVWEDRAQTPTGPRITWAQHDCQCGRDCIPGWCRKTREQENGDADLYPDSGEEVENK